ncbi:MAG: hypothetical protein K0S36_228 [Nitrosospira multiformis]|jgi:hypothetical protein|nr:hypothetical protein [Nitrosospira multiformis]
MDFLVIFGRLVFYRGNNDMKKLRVFQEAEVGKGSGRLERRSLD